MPAGVYSRPPLADRFWAKVQKTDGCWTWTGALSSAGYGVIQIDGKAALAHRVAYELVVGSIPVGLFILHSCDNPPCVNPTHLSPGTQQDNIRDAVSKGRWAPKGGEYSALAKLTWAIAREIRSRATAGEGTAALAREFGVTPSVISRVKTGNAWREAPTT